jgi:hypothetical protein
MNPSNRNVTIRGMSMHHVRVSDLPVASFVPFCYAVWHKQAHDGMIVRIARYWDTADFLKTLGLEVELPKPGTAEAGTNFEGTRLHHHQLENVCCPVAGAAAGARDSAVGGIHSAAAKVGAAGALPSAMLPEAQRVQRSESGTCSGSRVHRVQPCHPCICSLDDMCCFLQMSHCPLSRPMLDSYQIQSNSILLLPLKSSR